MSLFATTVFSTELDSLTNRDPQLIDSYSVLNLELNNRMALAVKEANESKKKSCRFKTLRKKLKKSLKAGIKDFYLFSPIEHFANKSELVDRQVTKKKESIYRHINFFQSVPINVYPLGGTIKVSDHFIAGDKFSHFFNVGFTYYKRHYKKKRKLERIVNFGHFTEVTIYGKGSSGVYSYSDQVANFNGMRFWGRVEGVGIDPITGNPNVELKYFDCVDNKWEQIRKFDWLDYVDSAWDEGVNCNAYRTKKFEKDVILAMEELSSERGREITCPNTSTDQEYERERLKLVDKYGDFAYRLLNLPGLDY
jgi:hypothetical protein